MKLNPFDQAFVALLFVWALCYIPGVPDSVAWIPLLGIPALFIGGVSYRLWRNHGR